MERQSFNPSDSIQTIQHALTQARSEKTGAAYYFILWGIILFVHYGLFFLASRFPAMNNTLTGLLVYLIFPLGGLLSFRRSKQDTATETVRTHAEKVYLFAFSGFALCYGTLFAGGLIAGNALVLPLFPMLLGFTVFVTGGITRDRVSLICGLLGILCSGISLNVPTDIQYGLAACAALVVCVVPGLLMQRRHV